MQSEATGSVLASRAYVFAPSDYSFELPPELIAQEPAPERDGARLLHVAGDTFVDDAFSGIDRLLPDEAVVVVNDARVIPARVLGHRDTGGRVELLFLEPDPAPSPPGTTAWRCLAKARRPMRAGQHVAVSGPLAGTPIILPILTGRAEDGSIAVAAPGDGFAFLDEHGQMPLPRYIQRDARAADRDRYQTMFARVPGAVAAPTAGLHMTPAIVERLAARRITIASLTLHVGYGTFEPIRCSDIREHHMHRERYEIPATTAALVASGRPIVALGTTALRALEAAALTGELSGSTDLFIYPESGHEFRSARYLITNFHLPESTLLMLVCAFGGTDRVLAAYRHAIDARYRFFSYGDAMLVQRAGR
jgi:S-adenosylmethionine:tRNA ribosyltransferase-isomerase